MRRTSLLTRIPVVLALVAAGALAAAAPGPAHAAAPVVSAVSGEVLLSSTFDTDAPDWTPTLGDWSVVDGHYVVDAPNDGYSVAHSGDASWTDYDFSATFDMSSAQSDFFFARVQSDPMGGTFYRIGVWPAGRDYAEGRITFEVYRAGNVVWSTAVMGTHAIIGTNQFDARFRGDRVDIAINGQPDLSVSVPDPIPSGGVGVGTIWRHTTWFDDVLVTALDTTPPVVTPVFTPPLPASGWFTTDVTLSWSVSDLESTVTATSGCDPVTVTVDTPGTTFTCSATSEGGTTTTAATVKRDAILPAGYVTKDLGTLGGTSSAAVAVSTTGYAVGWAQNAAGRKHAVRWNPAGVIKDLGTLGGQTSEAVAVNDDGTVVGTADKANGSRHAFVWTAAGMRDLGTLGGASSSAADINRSGQVTGTADRSDGVDHAFLWSTATGMRDLGTLGEPQASSAGSAINDNGQVTGRSRLGDGYPSSVFRWTPQTGMTDILASLQEPFYFYGVVSPDINEAGQIAAVGEGYSPEGVEGEYVVGWDPKQGVLPTSFTFQSKGYNGYHADINDSGQIAGTTEYPYPPEGTGCWTEHAFRVDPDGTTHEASADFDCQSLGQALNNAGEVVGRSWPSGHAFVWNPASGDQLRDLGALGGPQSDALAISDTGRIVGTADTETGASHAVRWDPPTGTTTSSVVAVRDTYVAKAAATTVFGFSSSLASGASGTYLTYLRFTVPTAPAGRQLVAATLRLHTTNSSIAGSADALEVRQASTYWSEATTTWNNRPTTGPAHLGYLGPVAANSYATVRLDPTKVTPGAALDLVVDSNNGDSAWFWSRSYATTAYRPALVLIYR